LELWVTIETIFGLLMFGIFIASITRKYMRWPQGVPWNMEHIFSCLYLGTIYYHFLYIFSLFKSNSIRNHGSSLPLSYMIMMRLARY
jgi:presenilin-like A22 family membrane protease